MGGDAPGAALGGVHGFASGLTSFVGRAAAVAEVARLVGGCQLVTVTGPGGVGKTRLAGEVAAQVAGRFADGVWLVELAGVGDPGQVPGAVAAVLGVRQAPGVAVAESLAEVLAARQLLLVLDNCEHVIGAAAELCGTLLAAADDVTILATSREPLAVAGEARYRLAPLTLPRPGDPGGAGEPEAVVLFADRARRADPPFRLDGRSAPIVGEIVARLDGMPLAIELAAARVEALGLAELAARLDDRFAVLGGTDRLAPARHRSLAAAVEWSYQLLDEQQRRVFCVVSAFPGPFTLAAAEAVAGPAAGAAVLHLVDCSLLAPPRPGPDGRARYAMLETLRAYGAGRLAQAGEDRAAAMALAAYALGVAEEAGAELATSSGELAAAAWLDAEAATMRQVLAWALDDDPAAALRLAAALAPWWLLRGQLGGGYPVLRAAADRAGARGEVWRQAQFWLGMAALDYGDLADALGHFTAARDAAGDQGPSRLLAECLGGRSVTLSNMGQVAEGIEDGRRAVAAARQAGDPAAEAFALVNLSVGIRYAGDLDRSVQLARQAQQITGDVPGWMARTCAATLTTVLADAGDLAAAAQVGAAGLAQSREAGDTWNQAALAIRLADPELQAGRLADAAAHLREGLQIVTRGGGRFELVNALEGAAFWCAATGRHAEAVTLLAATEALERSLHIEGNIETAPWMARRQEAQRHAQQVLGPDRPRAAAERGAVMSTAAAAEYVLLITTPAPRAGMPDPGGLSPREKELVTLVAQGLTDVQIAERLFISVRTVRSHLDRIRDKTGCRRRADLTRLALQAGLI